MTQKPIVIFNLALPVAGVSTHTHTHIHTYTHTLTENTQTDFYLYICVFLYRRNFHVPSDDHDDRNEFTEFAHATRATLLYVVFGSHNLRECCRARGLAFSLTKVRPTLYHHPFHLL